MFNQRMRVFLTQNLDIDPHQAIIELRDCIVTEAFEYALRKNEVVHNENIYEVVDIVARSLKDVNGGVYKYCPCPCGIVFDANLTPFREIAIEYITEPGLQVQQQEFDVQQHILDMQMRMAGAQQQQHAAVPLEQLPHGPPQLMEQQQQQQFMMQYQNLARQHYDGFMQQLMAPQGHVNLPQNVHNNNIQGHVENPQYYIEHPQEYAVNLQELEARNEIIEQHEVAVDEEEDESDEYEDEEMEVDDEDMEEEEEEIEEEEEVEEDYIEEEEHVHIVPQPQPPPVEEPIQCYGVSSTSSDDSDDEIWRGENPINYNRRNAIQSNKISSTVHMEGDESDNSDDEYDDGDWSTDSSDELN